MLRIAVSVVFVVAVLFTPALLGHQEKEFRPRNFKTNLVGEMGYSFKNEPWQFKIVRVIDKTNMVCRLLGDPNHPFLVKNFPTTDLVDGGFTHLPGTWKVIGTQKVDARTMFAIEPHKEKK